MLDFLPHLIDSLDSILAQRTIINGLERFLQLLDGPRANDDRITMLFLQRTVVSNLNSKGYKG